MLFKHPRAATNDYFLHWLIGPLFPQCKRSLKGLNVDTANILIMLSQNPSWPHQIASFVQLTGQNPNILQQILTLKKQPPAHVLTFSHKKMELTWGLIFLRRELSHFSIWKRRYWEVEGSFPPQVPTKCVMDAGQDSPPKYEIFSLIWRRGLAGEIIPLQVLISTPPCVSELCQPAATTCVNLISITSDKCLDPGQKHSNVHTVYVQTFFSFFGRFCCGWCRFFWKSG